jgi:hypothetical protein
VEINDGTPYVNTPVTYEVTVDIDDIAYFNIIGRYEQKDSPGLECAEDWI